MSALDIFLLYYSNVWAIFFQEEASESSDNSGDEEEETKPAGKKKTTAVSAPTVANKAATAKPL